MKLRLRRLPGALSNPLAVGLVLLLALTLTALRLVDPIPLQSLRLAQFDQFQRWFPREFQNTSVRIVDIDENSLQTIGQWPWPRTRVAELVERLDAAGAAAIAFDVILSEPDRTSPRAMERLWRVPGLESLLRRLPDHDNHLAEALRDRPVVLGTSLSRTGMDLVSTPRAASEAASAPYRLVRTGTHDASSWLQNYDAVVRPLPQLATVAAGLGALNFNTDNDGVVRRVPLLLSYRGEVVPTLSAEALRVGQGARNLMVRANQTGVQDLRIGAVTIPTNPQGEVWLHYTERRDERFVSAARVLDGRIPPGMVEGHIVLIGSSAAGLMDLRFNPMGELMPGVQAHALALEQILTGHHLIRPAWSEAVEVLAIGGGALLIGFIALAAPAWWSTLAGALLLALVLGGAAHAFSGEHLLIDGTTPALALLLSFGLGSGLHHIVSERQQRWVREAFSRYVSPNRVDYLVAHPEQLQLGGQRQTCSFIFTDLAGFTTLMEVGDPARAVNLLNDYLDSMLAIVFRYEGTLDRIVGDAVAVMFSAPVLQPDHRQRALDCALEMDRFASAYAARVQAEHGMPWGQTRIGVHCGEVIVGNFGGKTLFDYRALGDPINTAARLESVNKHLGTRMCVSAAILDGLPPIPTRPVGQLVLKGKSQALQVFEPEAATGFTRRAPAADYQAAFDQLQSGASEAALLAFSRLAEAYPEDPLVQLHLERLKEGATSDRIVMSDK